MRATNGEWGGVGKRAGTAGGNSNGPYRMVYDSDATCRLCGWSCVHVEEWRLLRVMLASCLI